MTYKFTQVSIYMEITSSLRVVRSNSPMALRELLEFAFPRLIAFAVNV